ncbi:lipase/acyltransferase domain-containing protein [Streptomyces sp. CA-179760]|uniref:lipase/acyltransferase domain-containing protein n=1 Tax=Streptomyces sp. CA-179760 TaxID=3240054 RepID=UPI003D91F3BF
MSAQQRLSDEVLYPDRTHDAVVVIPGIMGSELRDGTSGSVLWGLDPRFYGRAWLTASTLRALQLTEAELAGEYGRVTASRLLHFPAWLPFFRGFEPYTALVDAVYTAVVHPAAVLEFPYDWRLPVAYNAERLAEEALAHLTRWQEHPSHVAARGRHATQRPAQLVLVAHSMGGLLVRHLPLEMAEKIRVSVTLGTPFHGSPKAAALLNSGRALVPLPARRPASAMLQRDPDMGVRALAVTLPGVYDLLPTYRSVDDGRAGRRLSVGDVVALGGDAIQAQAWHDRQQSASEEALVDHQLVVGAAQHTPQSLRIDDGVVRLLFEELGGTVQSPARTDRLGDGTVPTGSAELRGVRPTRLDQQHQQLAKADAAIRHVQHILRERDLDLLGPPMGPEEGVGLDVPDAVVAPGEEWVARATGVAHQRGAYCLVSEVTGAIRAQRVFLQQRDDDWYAPIVLPQPGLYRVALQGLDGPVSQLVLAADLDSHGS